MLGAACVLLVLAFQPDVAPPPSPSPQQPPPTTPALAAQPTLSARQVLDRAFRAYRAAPIAQSARIRTQNVQGKERTSHISIRTQTDDPALGLTLGRALRIWVEHGTFIAQTPRNKALVVTHDLAGPITPALIASELRSVPIPQITFAFGEPPRESDGVWRLDLPPLGRLDLPATAEDSGSDWIVQATGPAGPTELRIDKTTGLLRRLSGFVPTTSGPLRLDMSFQPTDATPAAWRLTTDGRTAVASLADLKPSEAEVSPGAVLPNLGLMTTDLIAYSWRDDKARAQADPAAATAAHVLTAYVFFRENAPEAADAAFRAAGVLVAARKDLDRKRLGGTPGQPLLLTRPVVVFELSEFAPARPKEAAQVWIDMGETLLWTTSGQTLIDRFASGAPGVVVIADEEQVVRGVIPLETGQGDPDAVLSELRALIDETLPPPEPK